jgi:cytochrome c553
MLKEFLWVTLLPLMAITAHAQLPNDKGPAVEQRDDKGNALPSEKVQALKRTGDPKAGLRIYQALCEECHLPSGAGNPDGSIPQLAGQHPSVLIKQLSDIRSGLRENPKMIRFAKKLPDAHAIADVAAYVSTLCIPRNSGEYAGADGTARLAQGKVLYDRECAQCHQPNGEGLKEMFYPVLAGQHFQYLLRQMNDVHDGTRTNVPVEMTHAISRYSSPEIISIAIYQSSLTTPKSILQRSAAMCKAEPAKGDKAT